MTGGGKDEPPAADRPTVEWRSGDWGQLRLPAEAVRRAVFVEEMDIDEALDFDGTDPDAVHIVAYLGGEAVGTGRLHLPEARIGRMAVRKTYRGLGIGRRMLRRLIHEAIRRGFPTVTLHAQEQAIDFYLRFGFSPVGERFMEAGIPHQLMRLDLHWREAVAAVIVREGKLLLGLRFPGLIMGEHWDLFGGRIEPGETPREALVRELREELAIAAEIGAELGISLYPDPGGNHLFRCPVYLVTAWQGEIRLNDEHTDARWFRPNELRDLRLAHPDIPRLFADALRDVSGGKEGDATPL